MKSCWWWGHVTFFYVSLGKQNNMFAKPNRNQSTVHEGRKMKNFFFVPHQKARYSWANTRQPIAKPKASTSMSQVNNHIWIGWLQKRARCVWDHWSETAVLCCARPGPNVLSRFQVHPLKTCKVAKPNDVLFLDLQFWSDETNSIQHTAAASLSLPTDT